MPDSQHANPAAILIIAATVFILFYLVRAARSGREFFIRRLPGVDTIEESLSRAAELGRPAVFCSGLTQVGPVLYSVLGILQHVAQRAARLKVELLLPQNAPDVMAITESTALESYRKAGKASSFNSDSVIYLSDEQFAFASGYMGLVTRKKAAATFLFGVFAAEALILAEAGQQVGAMQIAGSISPEQTAFFVCTCDATLIGEELFAVSAYLDRDPVQVASILTQDLIKAFFWLLIVLGVIASTLNSFYPEAVVKIESLLSAGW